MCRDRLSPYTGRTAPFLVALVVFLGFAGAAYPAYAV